MSVGHRGSRRAMITAQLVLIDVACILVAALGATWLRFGTLAVPVSFEDPSLHIAFHELALILVPLWVVMLALNGLYDMDRVSWGVSEIGSVSRALSLGVVALILVTFMLKMPGLSRAWTLLTWSLAIALVVIGRSIFAVVRASLRRRGRDLIPTLVVGTNAESSDIIRILKANPEAGLVPVGCLSSSLAERLELDYCSHEVPVIGHARDIKAAIANISAETVILSASAFDHDVLARIIAELRDEDVDVHLSSGLFEVLSSRVLVSEVAGVPLITIRGLTMSRANRIVKRGFDLTVASLIVLLGLPVWVALAAAIKLSSRGPIFYSQTRVGENGTHFQMYKFRSMYIDADKRLEELAQANEASGPLFKMKDDPRVTPVGKWLRKFSVDEFPQLLNVLEGTMSLVGPRPPLPSEVEQYTAHDWRRLEVVPGMTGLWQVSGRSSLTFDEMVRLDIFYIENWSVALDMALLFRTVPAVLFAKGAY